MTATLCVHARTGDWGAGDGEGAGDREESSNKCLMRGWCRQRGCTASARLHGGGDGRSSWWVRRRRGLEVGTKLTAGGGDEADGWS